MLKQVSFARQYAAARGPGRSMPAQPQHSSARPPPQSVEDRTSGMKKLDGYFPLYWDERTGGMFLEISRFDTDFLFNDRPVGRPRLERHRSRSRSAAAAAASSTSSASARASCWCRATSRSDRAARIRSSASRSRTRSRSRSSGASPSPAESNGRVLVDATDFFMRDLVNAAGRLRPGNYRLDRTRSAFYLPEHAQLPEEHRSRHDADVRQRADRRRWRRRRRPDPGSRADRRRRRRRWWWRRIRRRPVLGLRRQRHAVARSGDDARACVVRASCRTTTSSRASTIRAPVTAASRSSTTASRSANRSSSATSVVIACRRRIRTRRSASRSSRFSTGSIPARRKT